MKRTIHFLLLLFLLTTAVYASDGELGKNWLLCPVSAR